METFLLLKPCCSWHSLMPDQSGAATQKCLRLLRRKAANTSARCETPCDACDTQGTAFRPGDTLPYILIRLRTFVAATIKQSMRNKILSWSCPKHTALVTLADFCHILRVLTKWNDHRFIYYHPMLHSVLGGDREAFWRYSRKSTGLEPDRLGFKSQVFWL